MRNRRLAAGTIEASSRRMQKAMAIINPDKDGQNTTTVPPQQLEMCSSDSFVNNRQDHKSHPNDSSSQDLLSSPFSAEKPQVRSRSHSPHLPQRDDHLLVGDDLESKSSPSHLGVKATKSLTIVDNSSHLFPPSPVGQDKQREDNLYCSTISQPVEPPVHLVYVEPQPLLQDTKFADQFHPFSCRYLVTPATQQYFSV